MRMGEGEEEELLEESRMKKGRRKMKVRGKEWRGGRAG
jgi:hypothetical protein